MRLDITIANIDDVQAAMLVRMLWLMQHCGRIGASRWLAFYADGDGAFKPDIFFSYAGGESLNIEIWRRTLLGDNEMNWEEWPRGNVRAILFNPD